MPVPWLSPLQWIDPTQLPPAPALALALLPSARPGLGPRAAWPCTAVTRSSFSLGSLPLSFKTQKSWFANGGEGLGLLG